MQYAAMSPGHMILQEHQGAYLTFVAQGCEELIARLHVQLLQSYHHVVPCKLDDPLTTRQRLLLNQRRYHLKKYI